MTLRSIAVIAFNRISAFHLAVPCVVFGDRHPGAPSFDLRVCTFEDGPINTTAGFEIVTHHRLDCLAEADAIIVPSWRNPDERPPPHLLDALREAHGRGTRIVGLCLGAYVLAEAGLLSGRCATTHWAYAADFARRYPDVRTDPNVLYIEDGDILTSAGTAAGLDCCLHLLRQSHGAEVANSVARRLVTPPHRQGGQAQFIDRPLPVSARDTRITELLDWVRANLSQAHSLDSIAERALRSRRTFTRYFRQITGTTFGNWLLEERLAYCRRLLETSEHDLEYIASLSGFGSPVSLRHHFRRTHGVSPNVWRKTFRGK